MGSDSSALASTEKGGGGGGVWWWWGGVRWRGKRGGCFGNLKSGQGPGKVLDVSAYEKP